MTLLTGDTSCALLRAAPERTVAQAPCAVMGRLMGTTKKRLGRRLFADTLAEREGQTLSLPELQQNQRLGSIES